MATNYFDELEERRKKILGESYKPISKTAIEKTNESFEERRQRILTQQPEKKPSQVAATEIKEEKKQSWFDKIKTGVKKAIDTINPKKKISEEAQTKPIADLQAQTGLDTTGLAINQKNILDSQIEKLKIEDQKQAVVSAQMTDYGKDRYSPEKQKELRQQRQEEVKAATRTELKEGYKEPKAFGQAVESLFQSTVGLASSLGAGSEMIGQMTGSVILTEAGQKIKLEADKVIASNPEWNPPEDQKWGVDKIARLVAASAPSLLGAVGAGMVAGPVGLFAYGAVMEGGATYGEAVDAGTEEGKAQIYGSVVGIVNGTIETIFPNELLSAPAKQAKKKITKKIVNKVVDGMVAFSKRFVKGGVQEGGEEFLQQLVSNTVATNYDENRKLWDDLLESFVGGSLTGGLLQQFEGRVTYPSTKIDMTPEAARESVEISDLKDTPAGEAILKVADEAETKNASVVIDLSGQDGDVVVTPDKNKVGVAIGSKIEPIVSQEEQVTSLEPLKQAETKEVVTSEVKTDSQIETAKQTLINEAKDYKTATEFATDKIFTDSLSGIEKQVLDSYEGETTADKLEALYKESKQTKEQPKEVTKVQEAETDIDMDELPAEVQQKAEEDWVDNYAEKYGKMEEEVRVLDRLIKEARADEREVLKAKRAEIVKRQGKMEEGFINKYQPKKKVVKKKVEKKKQKETEKLEKVNYDPEKLELNIYDPNTFGNPDPNKYEVQVRYKGFISDKAKFDTKKQAEDFVANYQFKGMTTNVAGDYMESRFFKETYLANVKVKPKKVETKPKVKVKLLKQPSKVDPKKVVAVLDKKQTKQLPILQNVKVDNGKMIATDLKSYVILNTDKKDSGLFRLVGNDLVKSPDPIADFPDGPDLTKMKLKAEVLSENLIDVFSKTKLYIEKKDDRPTLTGVNIKIDKGIASITATDGFRLYNQEIGVKSTEKLDAIIPAKNLDNLIKLLGGGKVSIKADNDFISFTNTTGSVVVKTLVGDYPNINMVFNNNYEKTLVFDKKAFGDAVKQLEAIAKLNYNKVELSTEGNKLKLKTDVMIDDKKTDEKVVTVPISKQMKRKVKPGVLEGALVMPVRVGDGDIPNPEAGTYNYRYLLDVVKTIEGKDLYFDYQPNELQP